MTTHEETAKRMIEKIYKDAGYHPQVDNFINAVAAALAQAEAKGVRMGLERAREIFTYELRPWQEIDAEIAKAGK